MRVHVAFTPGEATRVPTGIVVDVLRATSTIVQAVDAGYGAIYCCAEVEEAQALREELGDAVLGGERGGDPLPGFDLGNSPLEYLEPRAETLVLTTTNGTRAVIQAAANCDLVLVGSMLNLDAVAFAPSEGSGRPSQRKTWSGAHGRASYPRFLASTACEARPRA